MAMRSWTPFFARCMGIRGPRRGCRGRRTDLRTNGMQQKSVVVLWSCTNRVVFWNRRGGAAGSVRRREFELASCYSRCVIKEL